MTELAKPHPRPGGIATTAQHTVTSGQPCPFCRIVAGSAPAEILLSTQTTLVFRPLNPVTEGHVLVVPHAHVDDWTTSPSVSAETMRVAAAFASTAGLGDCNLITSRGRAATQSVFHLHLHIVPRNTDDGLALPWHSGKT